MSLLNSLTSSDQRLALLARLQKEQARRAAENKLASYRPYAKQKIFHNSSTGYRERLFMAGNQLGKTLGGAVESSMHLTGLYPDWWEGRRFDRPVRGWAGSKTNEVTRDGVQRYLVGEPKNEAAWGTGWIPKAHLKDWTRRQGVPNALDGVLVEHVSGGLSMLGFKSYDMGREKWQAETLDFVWLDEEPDHEIYMEALTRTNATGGFSFLTFTPLLGMSKVVESFVKECGLSEESAGSAGKHITRMTIYDAAHYSEEQREAIISAYPAHERDARIKGLPALGSGRIFPVAEEEIVCDAFPIPAHWPQVNGVDFGWDHPFAATSCAWDRESDIWYVTRAYRQKETTPVIHAAAMKPWGDWIPVAWPHDGLQHDKGSGEDLASQYRSHGLNLLEERATHEDGGNGVEAGLLDMLGRMQTGRWKVFRHLSDWLEEFRLYHRKDGKIVKERDDLISSSRYAYMMRRFAETEPNRSGWGNARRRAVV